MDAADNLTPEAKESDGFTAEARFVRITITGGEKAGIRDFRSLPTYKELPNVGYQPYPTFYAITNESKNKDAAMEVIKYLTSDEYKTEQNRKGNVTVLKSQTVQKTLGQDTNFKVKNCGAFFYNKFPAVAAKTTYEDLLPTRPYGSIVNRLPAYVQGTMDINTLLRESEDEVNKEIDDYLATNK